MGTIKSEWAKDDFQQKHISARNKVKLYMEELNVRYQKETGYGFIRFMEERMKTPESIEGKLRRKEKEVTFKNALELGDISGVRIICYCLDQVYWIAEQIRQEGRFEVTKEKDYIKKPKWNGYESYHMGLMIPVRYEGKEEMIPVELQIRTIVMDAWASMDSRVSYKKRLSIPESMEKKIKKHAKLGRHLDQLIQESMSEVETVKEFRERMTKSELKEQRLLAERFLKQRRQELKAAELNNKKKKDKAQKKKEA